MRISTTKIATELARKGMNYTQLSKRAGIARQTMSTINTRKTCKPETAGKLAAALGCDVTDLIQMEVNPNERPQET